MTSTITELGAFDALEKARPGEPMFPLLGRDKAAPAAVTEWCRIRRNEAMKAYGHSKRARDKKLLAAELAQCANAERVAEAMADYRDGQAAPAAQRVSNGVQRTEAEVQEAEERDRVAAQVRHFREAAYHLSEARDALVAMGLIGEQTQREIVGMLACINGLADEFTPKRPGAEPAPSPAAIEPSSLVNGGEPIPGLEELAGRDG